MDGRPGPSEIIHAAAPIRICDVGGWTDTWFAGHGKVLNMAVSPQVEVRVGVYRREERAQRVVVDAPDDYGPAGESGQHPGSHKLLHAVVEEMAVPEHLALEIATASLAPPGSSAGTSAAVAVALIGALDVLTPGRLNPYEIARTAHRVEVERLGMESGVQDQLCAALGGINFIEIDSYPYASVSQLRLSERTWAELNQRVVLVHLGRAHVSSDVHAQVIAELVAQRGTIDASLAVLRRAATDARNALMADNLVALGEAMRANTEAQRRLHHTLVSEAAEAVIDVAVACGALGWKVNGAGGEGGSITLLCGPDPASRRHLTESVPRANPMFHVIPTSLCRQGVRVSRR